MKTAAARLCACCCCPGCLRAPCTSRLRLAASLRPPSFLPSRGFHGPWRHQERAGQPPASRRARVGRPPTVPARDRTLTFKHQGVWFISDDFQEDRSKPTVVYLSFSTRLLSCKPFISWYMARGPAPGSEPQKVSLSYAAKPQLLILHHIDPLVELSSSTAQYAGPHLPGRGPACGPIGFMCTRACSGVLARQRQGGRRSTFCSLPRACGAASRGLSARGR